jgi:large subunit ribosomal protein L3
VYKGKRMAGRMGNDQVTVRGLRIFSVDAEKNILGVEGLVPGAVGGLVVIQKEI